MTQAQTIPMGDLRADTAVTPVADREHVYAGHVRRAWLAFYAYGGVLVMQQLRAIEQALDRPELSPISAHATFCKPVPEGPVEVDVQVLRSGRSASQATANLRVAGDREVAVHLSAIFGKPRPASPFVVRQRSFPGDVPAPEEVAPSEVPLEARSVVPMLPVHEQTEWRVVVGNPPWRDDWGAGAGRFSAWQRVKHPPRLEDGRIDPFSYAFAGDVLAPALSQGLGPEHNMKFLVPTLELNIQFLGSTRREWLLQEIHVRDCHDGFALGTVELWDPDKQLVALVSQRVTVRPFSM